MKLKRVFLICLLVSIAAGAAIGIFGIFNERGQQEGNLLGTMMSIGLCSLTSLGTAIVIEKQATWRRAMILSFIASAVCLAYLLTATWYTTTSQNYQMAQFIGRSAGQSAAIAVALPLAGLLSLTRFAAPTLRAVRIGGITMVFIAAGMMSLMIWGESSYRYYREFSTVMILTILCVIGLPLLHKLAGMPPPSETVSTDLSISIVCPRCSMSQTVPAGPSRCATCKLKFSIEVEEPRCPDCSYLLYQLTEPRCPECGRGLPVDELTLVDPKPAL